MKAVEKPAKRRRKLSNVDMEAIARLVATRKLTEREACLMLEINCEQWECWKSRHKQSARFAETIARIRGFKIENLINRIESASEDADIQVGDKVVTKRGDWRAAAWITERLAPDRFALQANPLVATQSTVNVLVMHDTLKRILASPAAPINGFDDKTIETCQSMDTTAPGCLPAPANAIVEPGKIRIPQRRVKS